MKTVLPFECSFLKGHSSRYLCHPIGMNYFLDSPSNSWARTYIFNLENIVLDYRASSKISPSPSLHHRFILQICSALHRGHYRQHNVSFSNHIQRIFNETTFSVVASVVAFLLEDLTDDDYGSSYSGPYYCLLTLDPIEKPLTTSTGQGNVPAVESEP